MDVSSENGHFVDWRRAISLVEDVHRQPGYIFTKRILCKWFGVPFPEDNLPHGEAKGYQIQFMNCMVPFREWLLVTHKVDLRPLPGLGYEVIDPRVQAPLAEQQFYKKLGDVFVKTQRRVINVKTAALSDAQRRERLDIQSNLGQLQVAILTQRTRWALEDDDEEE